MIENYGQRLGELSEKLKGLAERESLEKEKLKSFEIDIEAMRKKEELSKKAHYDREKLPLPSKKAPGKPAPDEQYKIQNFRT